MQQLSVTVNGTTGADVVGIWLDWNNDGDFLDTGECVNPLAASADMMYTVDVMIPSMTGDDFDWMTDQLHARFRVFSGATAAPGGSLDCGDFDDKATDGEVEDYVWSMGSLPVTLQTFEIE